MLSVTVGRVRSSALVYRLLGPDTKKPMRLKFVCLDMAVVLGEPSISTAKSDPPAVHEGMVLVPAGTFQMGCNERVDADCSGNEKPGKKVHVAAFQIDKTEVTLAQYKKCVDAKRCRVPKTGEHLNWERPGRETHPINGVTWSDAKAFCAWKKKRLPTEAEWEKAARGTDGRKYAWGSDAPSCQYDVMDPDSRMNGSGGCGKRSTWPVGSKKAGASPYGALDMVGNVKEWTSACKDISNVMLCGLRGGSWSNGTSEMRVSNRGGYKPNVEYSTVGFRCAWSIPSR